MNLPLPLQQLILVFVAGMILFAQVTGLHHHLHAEAGVAQAHPSELHFQDSGMHAHAPVMSTGEAASAHHAHADVELKALADGLAKRAAQLLPVGLLLAVLCLLMPQAITRLRVPAYVAPTLRATPFSLQPPAVGPPGFSLIAV